MLGLGAFRFGGLGFWILGLGPFRFAGSGFWISGLGIRAGHDALLKVGGLLGFSEEARGWCCVIWRSLREPHTT